MSKYARTAEPPQVPCRATVGRVAADGTGELVTDGGMTVPFGRYACRGFAPRAGMAVWINLFVPDPDTRGYKAAIINALDDRRMADAIAGNRLREDQKRRELALLVRHGLAERDAYWPRLLERKPAARRALAAELVQLKRDSHVFDDL